MNAVVAKLKPDIFAWSAKYRIGIAEVDQQHRKLVRLINTLARMHVGDEDPEALLKVFDELASYAAYHFKAEETLMRGYEIDPDFESAHIAAHASFVRQAGEARDVAYLNPNEVTTQTLTFLSRWLIYHILGTDMRMANEIRGLEKGLAPAEARRQAIANMADTNDVLLGAMNELYENLAARTHDFLEANRQLRNEIEVNKRTEYELRKLSLAVEHSPASIAITNARGIYEYVNPRFVQVTGYTLAELAGKTPRILKSGESPAEDYAALWASISAGKEWSGEFHNRKKNGELYWDRASITPIVAPDGTITHFLSVQEDVTERKRAEAELQRSHAELAESHAELQKQASDLTLLNQTNELLQTCLTVDEAYRVIGHMAGQLELGIGGALAIVVDDSRQLTTVARWGGGAQMFDAFRFDSCWAIRRGQRHDAADPGGLVCTHFQQAPPFPHLCLPLVVLGETLGLLHVDAVPGCAGAPWERLVRVSVTVGEILKLALSNIRLRDALREQATRDPLTGLFNRRHFEESLAREVLRAYQEETALSVLMIDIDHFKRFNDQYGHEAGDRVLIEVASRICASLRQDDVACRFGGEEIAVVLPGLGAAGVETRMEGIAASLKSASIQVRDQSLPPITVSAGIATLRDHGADAESLVRAADHARYLAKHAGRNCVRIAE